MIQINTSECSDKMSNKNPIQVSLRYDTNVENAVNRIQLINRDAHGIRLSRNAILNAAIRRGIPALLDSYATNFENGDIKT